MADVFDDLAKAFKAGYDAGRNEAADEIERLREALQQIIKLKPSGIEGYYVRIARAALGEKE